MRKESRQDSKPRCSQGARVWQVPKMLLGMSTTDSSSSQLLFLDHPPSTTTLQGSTNPGVTPFVTAEVQHPRFGSNTLILAPSSLNLFSWAVTPSHATARFYLQIKQVKLLSRFYLLSFLPPTATCTTSAYSRLPGSPLLHREMLRENHVVFCPIWRRPLLKSFLYKSLQAAPGSTLCHADEAGGKTTHKQ